LTLEFVLVLAVLAVALLVVSAPLRRAEEPEERESADVLELRAARELKFREIRDAELDFRTGKLTRADYRETDRSLRAEAIEILRRLDEAEGRGDAGD